VKSGVGLLGGRLGADGRLGTEFGVGAGGDDAQDAACGREVFGWQVAPQSLGDLCDR
jgi:hypothetical protein